MTTPRRILSHVVWIDHSDLNAAEAPVLFRHHLTEQFVTFDVTGSYGAPLGRLVVRCERKHYAWVPAGLTLPDL